MIDNELCNQCGWYNGDDRHSFCIKTGEPDPDENMDNVTCKLFEIEQNQDMFIAESKVELLWDLWDCPITYKITDADIFNDDRGVFSDCVKTLIDEGAI